jgi:hypothetical protein
VADREFWLFYIALIVLLPMVPAIAIFKLLPSRAAVTGPFKGLKINLGGAFAGYFVLLVLLLSVFRTPPAEGRSQIWRVKGRVRFDGPSIPFGDVRISFVPPTERLKGDGTFNFRILATVSDDGEVEFPELRLEADGYEHVTLPLESLQAKAGRKIEFGEPIQLRPLPEEPYKEQKPLQAAGTPP